jgi:transposase
MIKYAGSMNPRHPYPTDLTDKEWNVITHLGPGPKPGGRGYDAGKRVKGSKHHIVVETLGLLLSVVLTAADVQDYAGATSLLAVLRHGFSRLRLI